MKNNSIKWVLSALADLRSIKTYIAKSSPKYAKIQIKRIIVKTYILKSNLRAGHQIKEIPDREVRYLILGNYKIIYLVYSDTEAHVLRIWHSSRDLNIDRDV